MTSCTRRRLQGLALQVVWACWARAGQFQRWGPSRAFVQTVAGRPRLTEALEISYGHLLGTGLQTGQL
jgi:hypothetical protein